MKNGRSFERPFLLLLLVTLRLCDKHFCVVNTANTMRYLLPLLFISACATGCAPQSDTTSATVSSTSVPSVPVATPFTNPIAIPPTALATPSGTPIDNRKVGTEADRQWVSITLPILREAADAQHAYLDSQAQTKEGMTQNIQIYQNALEQCRQKLASAPRSPAFDKAHDLLIQGVNQAAAGAELTRIGAGTSASASNEGLIKQGFAQMKDGGNLLQDSAAAAKEALSHIKD